MSATETFRHLPPAYFTVTVRQSTIDQWKRYGGRTTFNARSTKTEDSNRLVPSISVVDCFTGQPARTLDQTEQTGELRPSGFPLSEQDTTDWRIPVLVFCGTDDVGLSVEDEAYLGNPIDRNQACVIFSEQWVVDSIAAGRLRALADYAKHAPDTLNIDDPSLYLPCPFPPTYHSSTSLYGDDHSNQDYEAAKALVDGNARGGIRSLHVIGPYKLARSSPSLLTEAAFGNQRHKGLGKPDSPFEQQKMPNSCIIEGKPSICKSPHTPVQPCKPEPFSSPSIRSFAPVSSQHSTRVPQQESHTNSHPPVCFQDTDHSGDRCSRLLEEYIIGKKREHLCMLDYQAALWQQQKNEAEERREEHIVELELVDSGRSQSVMVERANLILDDSPSYDANKDNGGAQMGTWPAPRLELDARTLLQLLPPLERSSKHSAKGKGPERSARSRRCPSPSYYPYLVPIAPSLVADVASPAVCKVHPDRRNDFKPMSADISSECHSTLPKRVNAFHTAGFGLGWMDFEACGDWLVVHKQRRQERSLGSGYSSLSTGLAIPNETRITSASIQSPQGIRFCQG